MRTKSRTKSSAKPLTFGAVVEGVVVHLVVAAAQANADSVLDVCEGVVVDFRVEGFQDGQAGVLHVVHGVTWEAGNGQTRKNGTGADMHVHVCVRVHVDAAKINSQGWS